MTPQTPQVLKTATGIALPAFQLYAQVQPPIDTPATWFFIHAQNTSQSELEVRLYALHPVSGVRPFAEYDNPRNPDTLAHSLYVTATSRVKTPEDISRLLAESAVIFDIVNKGLPWSRFRDLAIDEKFALLSNPNVALTKKGIDIAGINEFRGWRDNVTENAICIPCGAIPLPVQDEIKAATAVPSGPIYETRLPAATPAGHLLYVSPLAALKAAVGSRTYNTDNFRSACMDLLLEMTLPVDEDDFFVAMSKLAHDYNVRFNRHVHTFSSGETFTRWYAYKGA